MSKLFMLNTVNNKSEEEITMSNEIMVFENEEFGSVRSILIDGEPWFVGRDIAKSLGYKDQKAAVRDLVDYSDKRLIQRGQYTPLDNIPNRGLMFINESGLYSLILSSELPRAKAFKRWVTRKVLPSIRKHGIYATEDFLEMSIADPAWAIGVLTALKEKQDKIKELTKSLEEARPKVEYYDEVLDSSSLIKSTIVAKDYGMSAIKLHRLLENWHVIFWQNDVWVIYQEYADKGYTGYKTYSYIDEDGVQQTSKWLCWTEKGK